MIYHVSPPFCKFFFFPLLDGTVRKSKRVKGKATSSAETPLSDGVFILIRLNLF